MESLTSSRATVATCNLNQWALDFDGNLRRIIESIQMAKSLGATFRLGPELEISGYGCEDHFLELDTFTHSEESLAMILESKATSGILCDIGCPILFGGVRYNCRVFCLDGQILLIRPKMNLADDGNYREKRFFSPWSDKTRLYDFRLSVRLQKATGQSVVKFGVACIQTKETKIAAEICEELWSPESPHTAFALGGVEIFSNGSGSHHQLRKLNTRIDLIRSATSKCGGCYMYSNVQGCDGGRLYYDGSSLICINGNLVAQASQFSLKEIEVVTAVVDLSDIRNYRQASSSFQTQASTAPEVLSIDATSFELCPKTSSLLRSSKVIPVHIHKPEEECALGPACWLWDYMVRSGASGFLLPLSGGADSASVAAIVRVMCGLAVDEIYSDVGGCDKRVEEHVSRFMGPEFIKVGSNGSSISKGEKKEKTDQLCNHILHTVYMGTKNSSVNTLTRAKNLASQISSYHSTLTIDSIVTAVLGVFVSCFGKVPKYESDGGSSGEDLALQNIQARLRMVMAYLLAQLSPWIRGNPGFLLVLGSANVDEALRGYMTKYDCSSADINPIGGICKSDLKRLLKWAAVEYEVPALDAIADARPSAELRPLADSESGDYSQTDEEDMGMSYAELGLFGSLRKIHRCGPVSMFIKLVNVWEHLSPAEVAVKVKRFFKYYGINRHKLTVLTPSYHAEMYSPDDNRFDLRPFLYNVLWGRQFKTIDDLATEYSA